MKQTVRNHFDKLKKIFYEYSGTIRFNNIVFFKYLKNLLDVGVEPV